MSTITIIIIVLVLFFLMLFSGHYISSILMMSALVGLVLLDGTAGVIGFLQNLPFTSVASYTLTTMPLYILMAEFIMKAGIIENLYEAIYNVSKGKASLLGVMTIILGGFLGAVSGSGLATAAGLSKMSYPELRERGYSRGLAGSISALAGSLSAVIPPSSTLVLYGVTATVSISTLFMATLIPGIMMIIIYAVITVIIYNRQANQHVEEKMNAFEIEMEHEAEEEEHSQTKAQKTIVIAGGLIIIVTIFGGIYSGLFTPTEAGGVGAAVAFIALLFSGKFTPKFFVEAMVNTVKSDAMILMMIMAGSFFSKFITLSMIPRMLVTALGPLIERPYILLALVGVFYFILFMMLDGASPILMTVPILAPVVQAAGFDLVWFGIFICVSATIGQMTPPVGLGVYTVSGVTKVPSGEMFKLTIIYAIATAVIMTAVMIVFPQVTSWLPDLLSK